MSNGFADPEKILSYLSSLVAQRRDGSVVSSFCPPRMFRNFTGNRLVTTNIGNIRKGEIVRTRLGICLKKARYQSLVDAMAAARKAMFRLHPYRCRLCRDYHLTSRTKGMFVGRKSDKVAP